MSILKIARMGHPVLGRRAEPVADPSAESVRRLAQDMLETMQDAGGTGLAAPQVHVPARLVVYFVSKHRLEPDAPEVPLTVLVNPVVTLLGDEIDYDWEGCLSVPGLLGLVPRSRRIRLEATLPDGGAVDREVQGFHARVLQHECDHLDGILYPQRMDDLSLLVFQDELRHGLPEKARALIERRSEEQCDGEKAEAL